MTRHKAQGHGRPFKYNKNEDPEEKIYILYVHGWNMTLSEKDQFAETAYKRLFWQGYRGRFGAFQWPCTQGMGAYLKDDEDWKVKFKGFIAAVTDLSNYDVGEWSAWRSADALKQQLERINGYYPNKLYVLAHSMGNAIVCEALRKAVIANKGLIVNAYVATQAAVPADTYQKGLVAPLEIEIPGPDWIAGLDGTFESTPNVYGDWFTPNSGSVGRKICFFNVNDYALWKDRWQLNQFYKPDVNIRQDHKTYDYGYDGEPNGVPRRGFYKLSRDGGSLVYLRQGTTSDVKNFYEIMSFAAEARTKPLGIVADVTGFDGSVDLQGVDENEEAIWPLDTANVERPYSAHKWHSAQFRSTNMKQKNYWKALLGPLGFNIISNEN